MLIPALDSTQKFQLKRFAKNSKKKIIKLIKIKRVRRRAVENKLQSYQIIFDCLPTLLARWQSTGQLAATDEIARQWGNNKRSEKTNPNTTTEGSGLERGWANELHAGLMCDAVRWFCYGEVFFKSRAGGGSRTKHRPAKMRERTGA